MMCSFYFYDVYDGHNYLLKITPKLNPFFGLSFCTDIMMDMVREDILTTCFGCTGSRMANRIADTTTERSST